MGQVRRTQELIELLRPSEDNVRIKKKNKCK